MNEFLYVQCCMIHQLFDFFFIFLSFELEFILTNILISYSESSLISGVLIFETSITLPFGRKKYTAG